LTITLKHSPTFFTPLSSNQPDLSASSQAPCQLESRHETDCAANTAANAHRCFCGIFMSYKCIVLQFYIVLESRQEAEVPSSRR
jgi:hypothetical protein